MRGLQPPTWQESTHVLQHATKARMKEEKDLRPNAMPSPFELIPPVLLSTLMMAFSIVEAGVAWRACSGKAEELRFATDYFRLPIPLATSIKMIVGPGILLLIPKIIMEDVLPLKRGTAASKKPHIFGILHLLPIALIFLTVPSAISAAEYAKSEHGLHLIAAQQLRSANLVLVAICILLIVLSISQVRAKAEVASKVSYTALATGP